MNIKIIYIYIYIYTHTCVIHTHKGCVERDINWETGRERKEKIKIGS